MQISALSQHRCHLGEGPLWDARDQVLYWVDSLAPLLYRYEYATGDVEWWDLPGTSVGSLAIRQSGGLVIAMDQGFWFFAPENGQIELIAEPLAGKPHFRFNDGKVDPFGAFVSGAMNRDYQKFENAPMYRLTPQLVVEEILDGFFCFNGPCFDEAGSRIYLTGRTDRVVEVLDYHADQKPANPRNLILDCNPDGATVDADDYIWSAQWGDACILRISPDGKLDHRIEFPGHIVSSVMFGGPDLDTIFVTTVGAETNGESPTAVDAGKLLMVENSGYRGRAEPFFKG